MLKHIKDWGALVAVLIAAATGLLWLGELRSDVNSLKDRVTKLEGRTDSVKLLRTSKGDLCLELLEQWGKSLSGMDKDDLMKRWKGADCEGAVPAVAYIAKDEATEPDALTNDSEANR
jgi:hypothetical protein